MKRCLFKLLLLAACQLNLVAAQSAENIRTFEPESFNRIIAGERGKPFASSPTMNIFGCSNMHTRICCCSCCRFLKSASEYRVGLILRPSVCSAG
jgi:hypothetical protein